VDKGESDIEDLIAERVYVDLVNKSFGLAGKLSIDSEKLANAQCESPRVEKRMEALFKLLPPEAPLFDHFTPADWLIRNPAVLDSEEEAVKETLAMFEKVFETYNRMLSVVRP